MINTGIYALLGITFLSYHALREMKFAIFYGMVYLCLSVFFVLIKGSLFTIIHSRDVVSKFSENSYKNNKDILILKGSKVSENCNGRIIAKKSK